MVTMSHDRGCPCGKEPYEYEDCTKEICSRRASPPKPTLDELVTHLKKNNETCIALAREGLAANGVQAKHEALTKILEILG